jgi:O-antigen ligase
VSTRLAPAPMVGTLGRTPIDLPEALFLLGAFVAPLNLLIVGAFSVYDVLVLATGFTLLVARRPIAPLPPGPAVAGYVFLVAATLSTFRATHPMQAVTQLLQFAFIFFVQLPVVLTMARSAPLLRWGLVLFGVGSLVGVAQAMVGGQLQGADRVLAFISDNPNRLGYLATYLLPFVLYLLTALWQRGRLLSAVVLGLALSYLLLWPLAASASRGATLGAIVALFTYMFLRPGLGPRRALLRLLTATLLVTSAGWVVVNLEGFPQTLRERIERTVQPEEQATLLAERQRLAVAGLRAFGESTLIGTGLDNFRHVAVRYDPLATSQAPHNMWIQSLAQVGLVGTLALLFILGWWFRRLYRACAATPPGDPHGDLVWAFVASMASIMTILMTIPVMNQRHYWLLYGLGAALLAQATGNTSEQTSQPPTEQRRNHGR